MMVEWRWIVLSKWMKPVGPLPTGRLEQGIDFDIERGTHSFLGWTHRNS
jgi:hypothetical protein